MPGARYQALRAAQFRLVAATWLRRRPWFVIPMTAFTLVTLTLAGFPRWRVTAVAALAGVNLLYQLFQARHGHCARVPEGGMVFSTFFFITIHAGMLLLTGGLTSPLIPMLLSVGVGTMVACGRSRKTTWAVLYNALVAIALAFLPLSWRGPPVEHPYYTVLTCGSVLFVLLMMYASILSVTDAYRCAGEALDKMREDILHDAIGRTRSLETIGAKVAHELKNPLAAVKGLVQLLARSIEDERSSERLRVISAEVTRMEAILLDYLSFSRPLDDLRTESLELGVIADDVLSVVEAKAEEAGVRLSRKGNGAMVIGDLYRIKEALLNLISNAIEATPPQGSVEISVRRQHGGAEVVIRDTGKGISPELLPRIGTPFFTTREGGTGLGVVLAKSVILQHGGTVHYASKLGHGTSVTVHLPTRPDEVRCPYGQGTAD